MAQYFDETQRSSFTGVRGERILGSFLTSCTLHSALPRKTQVLPKMKAAKDCSFFILIKCFYLRGQGCLEFNFNLTLMNQQDVVMT